jgi:hypothetical protein
MNRRNATLATSSLREASARTQLANSFMVSLRLGDGLGMQILAPLLESASITALRSLRNTDVPGEKGR